MMKGIFILFILTLSNISYGLGICRWKEGTNVIKMGVNLDSFAKRGYDPNLVFNQLQNAAEIWNYYGRSKFKIILYKTWRWIKLPKENEKYKRDYFNIIGLLSEKGAIQMFHPDVRKRLRERLKKKGDFLFTL